MFAFGLWARLTVLEAPTRMNWQKFVAESRKYNKRDDIEKRDYREARRALVEHERK